MPCCADADGAGVEDLDWETQNKAESHYRVRVQGQWLDVPDDAVVDMPNRVGRTMVWLYYINGAPIIRCFMPGVMS